MFFFCITAYLEEQNAKYFVVIYIGLDKSIHCGYSLEALMMSTHNMFFHGEIRKLLDKKKTHIIKSYEYQGSGKPKK